jgi:hypothetical protein
MHIYTAAGSLDSLSDPVPDPQTERGVFRSWHATALAERQHVPGVRPHLSHYVDFVRLSIPSPQ